MLSAQKVADIHTKLEVTELPFIPYPVDLNDLDEDCRLISATERERLLTLDLPDGHICKSMSGCRYVLVKLDGELHAVYSGKHALGQGGYGKVKVAQNIHTGKWEACKISLDERYRPVEIKIYNLLHKLIYGVHQQQPLTYRYFSRRNQNDMRAFFMELFDGRNIAKSLGPYAEHPVNYPAIELIRISQQLLQQLHEIHQLGIAHNDLYAPNILYSFNKMETAIIDFGESELHSIITHKLYDLRIIIDYIITIAETNRWLKSHFIPAINELRKGAYRTSDTGNEETFNNLTQRVQKALLDILEKIPPEEKCYKICMLDIGDFNSDTIERIRGLTPAALFDAMGSEIWLTDRKNAGSMNDYLKCRKFLESNNLFVGDKVFKHPSELGLTYHVTRMLKQRHPGCHFDVTVGARLTHPTPDHTNKL